VYKFTLFFIIFIFSCSNSKRIPAAVNVAQESSKEESELIDQGIKAHDLGNYSEAIKLYNKALDKNPKNAIAIFELSYSYSEMKNFDKALEYAMKGLELQSPFRARFYTVAANNLDYLGKPDEAIEMYKSGLKDYPNTPLMNYNLAVTEKNLNRNDDAYWHLLDELKVNSTHPSSYAMLSYHYKLKNQMFPHVMANAMLLLLEPNKPRSKTHFSDLTHTLYSGVTRNEEKPNQININIGMNGEHGANYTMSELIFKTGQVTRKAARDSLGNDENHGQIFRKELTEFFASLAFITSVEGFDYMEKKLIPFFTALHKEGHSEAFTYYISSNQELEDVDIWLEKNEPKVDALFEWANAFENQNSEN
jgi:tetratricopeptide (TPR) repeat protein